MHQRHIPLGTKCDIDRNQIAARFQPVTGSSYLILARH